MGDFERLVEIEQVTERSDSQINLELNLFWALSKAIRDGKSALCLGSVLENGQKSIGLEQDENGEIHSHLFTSVESASASGMNFIEVNLEAYLRNLVMIDDLNISGIVIHANTQKITIGMDIVEMALNLSNRNYENESDEQDYEEDEIRLKALVATMKGYEWIPTNACVLTGEDNELSEIAKETIKHIHYYMNGKNSFSLLDDHVAFMTNINPVKGKEIYLEELAEITEEAMEEAFSSHPDFSKYTMDDGMLAVELFNSVWCFCEASEFDMPYESNGEPSMIAALEMREMILEACQKEKVLAFVINDLTDGGEA